MKFKLIESDNQYSRVIYPHQLSPGDVVEELSFEGDNSPSKFTVDYVDVSNGKILVYTTDNSVLIYDSGETSIFNVLYNINNIKEYLFSCKVLYPNRNGPIDSVAEDYVMAKNAQEAYNKFKEKYKNRNELIVDVRRVR